MIGPGAVAEQEGEVVNFAGVAAFDHQPGAGPQPLADHFVVQARAGQERRDRRLAAIDAAVGEDDQVRPLFDGRAGLFDERSSARFQPRGPFGGREEHGEGDRLEACASRRAA